MRQKLLRPTFFALALFAAACFSPARGPTLIDVPSGDGELSESIIRAGISGIPDEWSLRRDCHESMFVPERHEFVFVEPTPSDGIAGIVQVRCEYDLDGDFAYCRSKRRSVRVFRRAEVLIISAGASPDPNWINYANLLVDEAPKGWFSSPEYLYVLEVSDGYVSLESGACGCFSRLVAPLGGKGRPIGDVAEVDPEVCF